MKFIELTNKSTGIPFTLNADAIESFEAADSGTLIELRRQGSTWVPVPDYSGSEHSYSPVLYHVAEPYTTVRDRLGILDVPLHPSVLVRPEGCNDEHTRPPGGHK